MGLNQYGTSVDNGELALILADCLNGMGDYVTEDIGSIAWCEAYTYARIFHTALQFIKLMSNQLNPNTASIFIDQWKSIYNFSAQDDASAQTAMALTQSTVGTPPSNANVKAYLSYALGNIFVDVGWAPELQYTATGLGGVVPPASATNYAYVCPLATYYIRVWQPRDNADNKLISDVQFNSVVESYKPFLQKWLPTHFKTQTYQLVNFGNVAGSYAMGYLTARDCYINSYNVVSGSAGTQIINGLFTTFLSDFAKPGYHPPIEVVDDNGVLQTYYIQSVISNTSLSITTPLINNITLRSYRTLGIIADLPGMADAAPANQ
jgi:hypothetical protein